MNGSGAEHGEAAIGRRTLELEVNGRRVRVDTEPRRLLSDVLRDELGLTGTHVGCEHGACGTCTVLVDDRPVRSCLMLAVQAVGRSVTTVEGLAGEEGRLHPVQAALRECHALQCGFCTPGVVVTLASLADSGLPFSDDDLLDHLGGHLCRCTGYRNILDAARVSVNPAEAPT